jgi:hypothetical protein
MAILASCLWFAARADTQAPTKPMVEARLALSTNTLHENDNYKIRVELENVTDHVILVGRDLTGIGNWPFRIDIRFEDSSGNPYGLGGAGYLDFPSAPDFSIEKGILRWWMPLAPHTFIGTYVNAKLVGLPPGKYRLRGTYLADVPAFSREGAAALHDIRAPKIPYFVGKLETNSVDVEVLPRAGGTPPAR